MVNIPILSVQFEEFKQMYTYGHNCHPKQKAALNIIVQVFAWRCVFLSLG